MYNQRNEYARVHYQTFIFFLLIFAYYFLFWLVFACVYDENEEFYALSDTAFSQSNLFRLCLQWKTDWTTARAHSKILINNQQNIRFFFLQLFNILRSFFLLLSVELPFFRAFCMSKESSNPSNCWPDLLMSEIERWLLLL